MERSLYWTISLDNDSYCAADELISLETGNDRVRIFSRLSSSDFRAMRTIANFVATIWITQAPVWAQGSEAKDDVRAGHHLAVMLCADCHMVASDQPYTPTLAPPAPSFQSIAQRSGTDMESLRKFLRSTHQSVDSPKGMPDPMLADFQIKQIGTYLLSLRK
jgi:mono/diheme cytochrome c family protein